MAAPTVRSSATRSTSDAFTQTLVIPAPSGVAAGDILVAALSLTTTGTVPTIGYPTGWTELLKQAPTMTGYLQTTVWAYKLAGGSEPGSYSFTTGTNAFPTGFIVALSGAGTPEAYTGANAAVSTNLITNPSVTTLGADRVVLYHSICNTNTSDTGHTPPSGFTELGDDKQANLGNGARRSIGWKVFTASGATGTFTTTMSATVADGKLGFTIAVPPSGTTWNGSSTVSLAATVTTAGTVHTPITASTVVAETIAITTLGAVTGFALPARTPGSLTLVPVTQPLSALTLAPR